MPRFALKIEYDGGPYAGWQRQKHSPSVQQTLETALGRLEADMPSVTGAGRTDTGVHALGQVANCDLKQDWDPFRLSEALNHHLRPEPVAILAAAVVAPEFSARFDATSRRYVFRLVCRRAPMTVERGRVWRVNRKPDVAAMREAAKTLIGHHDFTTFRSSHCQAKSPVKTLDSLEISEMHRTDGVEISFVLCARSFLHNQVRSIVGTLERVGAGAWPPERVGDALAARNRAACGPVSPASGLYLAGVTYPRDPFVRSSGER